jgi:hypothetical protein
MRAATAGKIALALISLFLAASVILPLLNRYRHDYDGRTPVGNNLHQIGLGILLYCNDHHGQFPDTLATLVANEQLSPKCLVDPSSDDTPAEGTPAEIAAQLSKPGHETFIYLGAGLTDQTADATRIVAYEPLTVYQNGSDALFGDGHCEWLTAEQLKNDLAHPATTQTTRP